MEKEKPKDRRERLIRQADESLASLDEALEAETLFYNWIQHGRSTTEADVLIEGSPDVVFYDPNQKSLWD